MTCTEKSKLRINKYKNPIKLSLKQLEAKKREQSSTKYENEDRKQMIKIANGGVSRGIGMMKTNFYVQKNKCARNLPTSNESLVDLYDASMKSSLKLTEYGRNWEDIFDNEHDKIKALEAKKNVMETLPVSLDLRVLSKRTISKARSIEQYPNIKVNTKTIDIVKNTNSKKKLPRVDSCLIKKSTLFAQSAGINDLKKAAYSSKKILSQDLSQRFEVETQSVYDSVKNIKKPLIKSSSALHISKDKKKLRGSYSFQKLDQSSKNLRKYFKPKSSVNPKEVDWMTYAKMKEDMIPELKKIRRPEVSSTALSMSKSDMNRTVKNDNKSSRMNFLEQLEMKRKYYKSSYQTTSPSKECEKP